MLTQRARAALRGLATTIACVAAAGVTACADTTESEPVVYRSPGAVRMHDRLVEMAEAIDPGVNIFVNERRAAGHERQLAGATTPGDSAYFWALVAQEQGRAGRTEDALASFEQMRRLQEEHDLVPTEDFRSVVNEILAAYLLRAGGYQACVDEPSDTPCLFPIPPERTSNDPRLETAISMYMDFLAVDPADKRARWLLNMTYMVAGRWPEDVPAEFLITPNKFESEYDIGRFEDVAPRHGIDILGHAGANIIEDFNRDNRPDLLASSRGVYDQIHYYERAETGAYQEKTGEAGFEGLFGGLNMVPTDYNNDGYPDILILRGGWMPEGFPNSLIRNNGDGTFDDVTVEVGLYSEHPTQAGAWGDYDNDGWLDLYIGNETTSNGHHVSELYHSNGDGTFSEVAAEVGVNVVGFVKGVAWGDYDNDGLPDLYVSRFNEPNILFHNDGPSDDGGWQFSDVSEAAGVTEPLASFPTWFWDYDNDGWLDIFVAGYYAEVADIANEYLGEEHGAEVPRLYRNRRDGTFEDVTEAVRIDRIMYAMGANYGDVDNDGWLDVFVGTGDPHLRQLMPNRMFRNAGGETFQDISTSGGFGHMGKGHGISFGDMDNDGDQDIYATWGGAYEGDLARNSLWENPGHGHSWVTLRLEGGETNRYAIGARVRVTFVENGARRSVYRVVGWGGSFGASSIQTEVGLGDATAIREVEVYWPVSGRRDLYTGLELNTAYRIREGDDVAEVLQLPLLDLSP